MPKLLLSILFLLVTLVANGQNTVAEEVVKIDASSATVHSWFQQIERQTKITLSYNPSLINLNKRIGIGVSGKMKVTQLLEIILNEYEYNLIPLDNRKLLIQIKNKKKQTRPIKIESSIEDFMLSINTNAATVKDWFALIEQQAHISLSYPADRINLTRIVKFQRHGHISVKQLIATLLKDYEYKLTNSENKRLKIEIVKAKNVFVTGIVEEAETGEKLFGATVSIADKNGTKALTATDKNGTFCLTTNRGTINLIVSCMGYSPSK